MKYQWVQCHGLWGSFNDSLDWIEDLPGPKLFCSLGSILGNDWFEPAVSNMLRFTSILGKDDMILIGMDSCKDKGTVWHSYHDEQGLFETFIRNGLEHSNRVLGTDWYVPEQWKVEGVWHQDPFMHQFAITALEEVSCINLGVKLPAGTQIDCYEAFKHDPREMFEIFEASNLEQIDSWRSTSTRIGKCRNCPSNSCLLKYWKSNIF